MALKDILVISGQSGLFRYISKGRKSVVVENISDNKRIIIPVTIKISMLDEITVFAKNNDISLRKIFRKIQEKENRGAAISHKSPDAELKKYFAELLPEYDRDRVYMSDIRKIIMWYNLLLELGITNFDHPEEEGEPEETVEAVKKVETAEVAEVSDTSENQ